MAVKTNGFEAFPGHETGNAQQNDDESDSDGEVDMGSAFEPLDELSSHFNSSNRAKYHDKAELQIDVAEGAVFAGSDDGFADNVGEVGANDEVHGNTDGIECRSGQKAAANAEKSAQ